MSDTPRFVLYNDGRDSSIFAIVKSANDDGTLNLLTFPKTSPVEHRDDVPEGTGGDTWKHVA